MANNERIIKGYEEEIDLLKQQNALLRENREKDIHLRDSLIESYRKFSELLEEKNALLIEMVKRQN